MDEELALLNAAPDIHVFRRSPLDLRPHTLSGRPMASTGAVLARFHHHIAVRGQAGVTLQPDWARWDDPSLFTDEDDYWRRSRTTAEVLRQQGGFAWIYDEPGFPSGSAGMRTLRGHQHLQACGIACVWCDAPGGEAVSLDVPDGELVRVFAARLVDGALDSESIVEVRAEKAAKSVRFKPTDGAWRLMAFVRVAFYEGTFTHNRRQTDAHSGRHTRKGDKDFDWRDPMYAYPNLLDPRATRRFLDVAYEPYAKHLGDYLGGFYRAFFTDEPLIPCRDYVPGSLPAAVPWCAGLEDRFEQRFGYDITQRLPALFFSLGGAEADVRCDFYELVSDLFAVNFVRQITDWCTRHNVYFTGHFLGEEYLAANVMHMGNILRAAREMSMPGIDHLGTGFVGRSLMAAPVVGHTSMNGATTPKLVSSAAHLGGWTRTASESHGFSGPNSGTSFSDYVAVANWETVLGINTLPYYCNDWLGSTEEQMRRYSEYAGRLNYMTAGGLHRADVAVLYPIADVWARFSPADANLQAPYRRLWTDEGIDRIQSIFDDLTAGLLARQLDFDFVEQHDIAAAHVIDGGLHIGAESFRALVLAGSRIVSSQAMEKLEEFRLAGGRIFAAGGLPERGRHPSENGTVRRIVSAWRSSEEVFVSDDPEAVAQSVADAGARDVALEPSCRHIYVLHRSKGGCEIYFLVNNSVEDYEGEVSFRASGAAQLWNAWTGKAHALDYRSAGDRTNVNLKLAGRTACFVVFGADVEQLAAKDDSMWHFGPKATTIGDYARWAADASAGRYFQEREPSFEPAGELEWKLLAPAGGLALAGGAGGETVIEVPAWRRLGWVIEGAACELALAEGVHRLDLEARAENIEYWCVLPMHFTSEGEIYEKGIDMMHWRHSLDAPGPHDWIAWRFHFKVPRGVTRTRIVVFPLDKALFSRAAQLELRKALLWRAAAT